jgi:hypothetical protein
VIRIVVDDAGGSGEQGVGLGLAIVQRHVSAHAASCVSRRAHREVRALSSSCRSADRRVRRVVACLVAAALTAAAGGCALSPQAEPDPVLLPSPAASTSSGGPQPGVPLNVQVYLIHGDRLQRVTRTVAPGRGIEPVVQALTAPLDDIELADGLRTAVPTTTHPLAATVTNQGTARVTVSPGFDRMSVREQQYAMAQLVFTVTADTLAGDVVLVNGSRVVAVPDDRGELLARPVTRLDYAGLAPQR